MGGTISLPGIVTEGPGVLKSTRGGVMRKLGILLAVVIVLLVAGALIVPHLVDVNSYHGQIQAQLEKKLGRHAAFGQMSLSLFPLSFQLQDARRVEDTGVVTEVAF